MLFVSIVVSMEINRRHYFRSGLRSTYGEEKKYIQGFWWRNLKEGENLVHIGIDRSIIL